MKIGVISDTHGIVPAWEKAIEIFAGVDLILHAGDVLYHPPRIGCTPGYDIPKFVKLMNASPIPIIIACGNCDAEVYEELLDIPMQSPYAFIQYDSIRIAVTHGHTKSREQIGSIGNKYKLDIIISGHTHLPLVERIGNTVHLNPGSASHSKYEIEGIPVPTVGLILDDEIRLLELNTGKLITSCSLKQC